MVGGGGDILAVGGWRWWMVVGGGIVQSDPTGFDSPRTFLLPGGKFSQNVTIFGVTMNSRLHIDNKKTDILILGEGPTQELGDTTLTAEKKNIQLNLLRLEKYSVQACIIMQQTFI